MYATEDTPGMTIRTTCGFTCLPGQRRCGRGRRWRPQSHGHGKGESRVHRSRMPTLDLRCLLCPRCSNRAAPRSRCITLSGKVSVDPTKKPVPFSTPARGLQPESGSCPWRCPGAERAAQGPSTASHHVSPIDDDRERVRGGSSPAAPSAAGSTSHRGEDLGWWSAVWSRRSVSPQPPQPTNPGGSNFNCRG
jgi:hypothetical protein